MGSYYTQRANKNFSVRCKRMVFICRYLLPLAQKARITFSHYASLLRNHHSPKKPARQPTD